MKTVATAPIAAVVMGCEMDKPSKALTGRTDEALTARLDPGPVANTMTDPLTVIATRIELMLAEAAERSVPAAVVNDLKVLDRNVKRLWVILDGLRRASGDRAESIRPVEINHLVHGPAILLEKLCRQERIQVTTVLDPSGPIILGYPIALGEMVASVLVSARAAVSSGHALGIDTAPMFGHPERIALTISTSGPGVADWTARALSPGHRVLLADHRGTVTARSDPASVALTLTFPRLAVSPRSAASSHSPKRSLGPSTERIA